MSVILKHSYLCNEKKITRWLEHMKFIFSWKKDSTSEHSELVKYLFLLKDKLHMFVPPCNILHVQMILENYLIFLSTVEVHGNLLVL